ncbi:hypothetical protein LCGC14_0396180 [marine sediment metagenome]|uniref:Uncharacterized protein n=1 Tax=marine sediment metagenome TaxID=412755 RepID=A0A0F9VK01_9ZZZZ
MKRDKKARYWGELVREICPDLYGKPVYDKDGNFIPYKMVVPKIARLTVKDLCR